MHSKREALAAVHKAMDSRLFSERSWPADREGCEAIDKLLRKFGFVEQISEDTQRTTPFGKEANLDLLMCFLGIWDKWEIPGILYYQGYVDLKERDQLYEQLEDGEPERVLRPLVQKVWRSFCNPSGLVS